MTEDERGNRVAKAVWSWLQRQRAIQYVPWVIDPHSEAYDHVKAAEQATRTEMLDALESEIRVASGEHQVEQPASTATRLQPIVGPEDLWIVLMRSPNLAETIVHRAFLTLEAAERSIVKDRVFYGWGEDVVTSCERISVMSDL